MTTFAIIDGFNIIEAIYDHTDDERNQFAAIYGRSYVYLPMGGEVGDTVEVDDDGEATVI